MAGLISLAARALAATACVSLVATPAAAASLPQVRIDRAIVAPVSWSPAGDRAAEHGGWGGGGGDWGGHRHHDHDDGIDAGDIFAGLLIIGGIAAIASAASKSDKNKDQDRYRNRDDDGYRYDVPPEDGSWQQQDPDYGDASRALRDAVDTCTDAARQEGRVDEIYGVQRGSEGYHVSGRLDGGREFACETGLDGGLGSLTVDGRELTPAN